MMVVMMWFSRSTMGNAITNFIEERGAGAAAAASEDMSASEERAAHTDSAAAGVHLADEIEIDTCPEVKRDASNMVSATHRHTVSTGRVSRV